MSLSSIYCRSGASNDFCMLLGDVALGKEAELERDTYMEKPQPGIHFPSHLFPFLVLTLFRHSQHESAGYHWAFAQRIRRAQGRLYHSKWKDRGEWKEECVLPWTSIHRVWCISSALEVFVALELELNVLFEKVYYNNILLKKKKKNFLFKFILVVQSAATQASVMHLILHTFINMQTHWSTSSPNPASHPFSYSLALL